MGADGNGGMSRDALVGWLAGGVAALLLCALALFALYEPDGARGVAHVDVPAMRSAQAPPSPALRTWGWVFGVLQIAVFAGLLALGAHHPREGLRGQARWLVAGALALAGIWTALVAADVRYAAEPAPGALWSLPAPTAWMLFGVWSVPIAFIGLYALRFDRFVYTRADRERFEALLRERGAGRRGDGDAGEGGR